MKYIKGEFNGKLDDLKNGKISLRMNDGFAESPWVGTSDNEPKKCVLLNHALVFMPFESWGMILPKASTLVCDEIRDKEEITLHPEAFDGYVERGIIDKEGNPLQNAEERTAAYREA